MVLNDSTGKLGIVQEIQDLCSISADDTASYPLTAIARRVNSALETLVIKIMTAAGTWRFDDTNFTDLPIGTGTLVSGQTSYSFAAEYLDIDWVKVMAANGHWYFLKPWDQSESDIPYEETLVIGGQPLFYEKVGDTIRILGTVTATYLTLASGIKVGFSRTASLFTGDNSVGDNAKVPGIASPFHITIARMTALPYCKSYLPDRVTQLERDIAADTVDMIAFYSRREKDKRKVATMKEIKYR